MNTSKLTIFCFALVAALASASVDKCWTETRKCRYEAKASGYKCKDYYPNMYARCHPIMKYEKVCEKPVTSPAVVGKPKDMTVWDMEKSKLVPYSKNYGPKCPSEGTSDYYETKNLPKHPINYPEVMAAKPTAAAKPKYAEKTAKPYVAPKAKKPVYKPAPKTAPKTAPVQPRYTPEPKYTAAPEPKTAPVAPTKPVYTAAPKPKTAPVAPTEPKYTAVPIAAPYKPEPTTAPRMATAPTY